MWEVAWAHPKFGSLLASCSFDGRVVVWKEASDNVWQQIYSSPVHTASVNSLAWAPYELGPQLAAASSDGAISVLSYQPDGAWAAERIDGAHPIGATAVSWSPAAPKGSLASSQPPGQPVRRLASAGCDNTVKVWLYNEAARRWQQDGATLTGHGDWVRDVAWAPNLGLPKNTLASAGQDGKVIIWTERQEGGSLPGRGGWVDPGDWGAGLPPPAVSWGQPGAANRPRSQPTPPGASSRLLLPPLLLPHLALAPTPPTPAGGWDRVLLHDFQQAVWRLSWSVSGNLLSVADAGNAVTIWKEGVDGQWQQLAQ